MARGTPTSQPNLYAAWTFHMTRSVTERTERRESRSADVLFLLNAEQIRDTVWYANGSSGGVVANESHPQPPPAFLLTGKSFKLYLFIKKSTLGMSTVQRMNFAKWFISLRLMIHNVFQSICEKKGLGKLTENLLVSANNLKKNYS